MSDLNLNLEDLRNIALIIVPTIVALISFYQYKVNKERYSVDYHKFRLDLFDKRYQVFQSALSLYKETIENNVTDESFNSFSISYHSSYFLYPKNSGVYELMDEIQIIFIRIRGLRTTALKKGFGQESHDYSLECLQNLSLFGDKIEDLRIKLDPFLSFSDFKTEP